MIVSDQKGSDARINQAPRHNQDRHPEDARMTGELQWCAQGDLGDHPQSGEERQQDELEG